MMMYDIVRLKSWFVHDAVLTKRKLERDGIVEYSQYNIVRRKSNILYLNEKFDEHVVTN